VNNQWFTEGYGDYIRHFLVGFAAIPEWAPTGANHLTGSTSLVTSVSYGEQSVAYTTRDATATDSLRLAFVPHSIRVDGQLLPERSDLAQPGWTHDPDSGVLRILRDSGSNVLVEAPETGLLAAGLSAVSTLGWISARRRRTGVC
jgi:hypothetical protein